MKSQLFSWGSPGKKFLSSKFYSKHIGDTTKFDTQQMYFIWQQLFFSALYYTGDTQYQVWIDSNNFLTRQKLLNLKNNYWILSQTSL